ncbi:MAG: LysR family transcriptional regulator [Eubacterium sp.]|nr:LysR family transcriptional regulator [Eubacterium sp.]
MTLNQMKYFIAVARCLNFTEAAKSLFITQPALSRQISAMEEELGTELFVRDKKKLKLTPGGLILYNGLPELLKSYDTLVEEAKTANQGYQGHLRLGILDVYDISGEPSTVLRKFQETYPQIQLSMARLALGTLPDEIYKGNLDIILTYAFSLFDKPDLITVDIQKYDSCLMINKNHPLAKKENLSFEDLKNEHFVQLAEKSSTEGFEYIQNLLVKGGITSHIKLVDKLEDTLLWVETGNYVTITSNKTIEKNNPNVVIRDIDFAEAKGHDMTVAWRKNNYNPAIALFMEMLSSEMEA